MTDARLRCEWHGRIDMDDLSDAAWRVFTNALMWSNLNGTDGWIPDRYAARMYPTNDSMVLMRAESELAYAGLIEKGRDANSNKGYQLREWSSSAGHGLGQSTAAEVKAYKANGARRAQRHRDNERKKLEKTLTKDAGVTRDVTHDVRAHVGKGKGKGSGDHGDEVPLPDSQSNTWEETDEGEWRERGPVRSWLTVVPPMGSEPGDLGVDEPAPWPAGESPFGGVA